MNSVLKHTLIVAALWMSVGSAWADEPPVCDASSSVMPVKTSQNRFAYGARGYAKSTPIRGVSKKFKAVKTTQATPLRAVYPARVLESEGRVVLLERAGVVLAEPMPMVSGSVVQLQDVIQTTGQSFVSIELGDGSQLVLPANSRVQLTQVNRRLARIKLLNGRVENYILKRVKAKSNVYEIQTPAVTLGVRGTYFKVAYDSNSRATTMSVLNGVVAVNAAQKCSAPLLVNAGEGVRVDANVPSQAAALLPAPVLVDASKAAQTDAAVRIKVEPVAGAAKYYAQLSRDDGFLNPYREVYSSSDSISFDDVTDGFYFVRVNAIDANGVEGNFTEHFFLRNLNNSSSGLDELRRGLDMGSK